MNRRELATAEAEAERLADRFGDLHLIYGWWGSALEGRGELGRARDVLKRGLAKARKKSALCIRLGELASEAGDIKEAVYWWAQAVHCQEATGDYGGSASAYLYLHYVAEVAGRLDVATAFLARADRIRPGQVRLVTEAADELQSVAARGSTPGVEAVLCELRDRYLL